MVSAEDGSVGAVTPKRSADGQADAANQRITDALGTKDAEPEPGDDQDGDSKKAT